MRNRCFSVALLAFASASLLRAGSPRLSAQKELQPAATNATQYSIGNPSNEQQYMLELINRARANGDAEAMRTSLGSLQEGPPSIAGEIWTITSVNQPLSWNPLLASAAQNHATNLNNADQFFAGGSPHTFGGTTPDQRIAATGYSAAQYTGPTTASGFFPGQENVAESVSMGSGPFTGAKLVSFIHKSHNDLFTDVTVPGRGHRSTMMLSFFREGGVGISAGTDNDASPGQPGGAWDSLYIVENFGTANGSTPFITGVVYNDANANGFYDPGEGIGGVRVDVAGSNFFAVTSTSGGYSVPVPGNGTYPVTFSGGGVTTTQRSAIISSNLNTKLDLTAAVSSIALESISTRARAGTNDDVIIGGFSIRGAGQKRILIRGLGPVLADPPFNVPNVLANPTLTVLQGQTVLATNDDWGSGPNAQELASIGKQPPKAAESALILTLPAGDYTAQVRGVNNTTGAALVQIYDLDPASSPQLDSISTRAVVGINDDVMIGGVNLQGSGTQKVVFRGIGPTLSQFNVPNVLANPTLRIADANGNTVAQNDDWQTDPNAAELSSLGLAPAAQEPAMVRTLLPGAYTAIVSGVNGTTGVALVQVYKIN